MKRDRKAARRELRRDRRLGRAQLRRSRRDDRGDSNWWGRNRRVARRSFSSGDDRNGRLHYSRGRGYFRDRGRRPNLDRRNRF
jgi:hypothetical protein